MQIQTHPNTRLVKPTQITTNTLLEGCNMNQKCLKPMRIAAEVNQAAAVVAAAVAAVASVVAAAVMQ